MHVPQARVRHTQPCAPLARRAAGTCPSTARPSLAAPVACARRPGDEGDVSPVTPHHVSRRVAWLLPAAALCAAAALPPPPAAAAAPVPRRPLAEAIRRQEELGASPRAPTRRCLRRVVGALLSVTSAFSHTPPLCPPARDDLVRREREFEVELQKAREEGEKNARLTADGNGLLCATPFGVDVVGITEAIALVGALVGGVSARQRKQELEDVNDKLRQINLNLRQQARSGTVYAPGLNYVPPVELKPEQRGLRPSPGDFPPSEAAEEAAAGAAAAAAASAPQAPVDVETEIRQCLRDGRNKLKESSSKAARETASSAGGGTTVASAANTTAMVLFKKALLLSKQHKSPILERRARRGLAVARRQHGDRKGALVDLLAVLEISDRIGEHTGDTDALGAIADLYTEQGDLENAGRYYDRYIAALKVEGSGNVD